MSDAAANAFGGGALMNFGDEATAAVRAALPEFSNWMMRGPAIPPSANGPAQPPQTVSTAPDFQGRYDEELARTRAQTRADEQAYPAMTTGANIAGNVATTALALPAAATSVGPRLMGNIFKMGATGAGLGAVSGFGHGEGGFENRVGSAILPAAAGGVLGAALPVAGMAGRAAMETALGRYLSENVVAPAARSIGSIFGGNAPKSLSAAAADGGPAPSSWLGGLADTAGNVSEAGAIERLATALQRGKIDPNTVNRRLGNLGDQAMLADVDPQFLSMARSAHTQPGETRTLAKNVLDARDRQAPDMIVRAFEGKEPPPSSFALRGENQAFDQNLRAVGSRAYGDMEAAGLKQTPELMKLYENPIIDKAINKVMSEEAATRAGTSRVPASPVDIMHKVKQEIADQGVAATGRGASTQSYYRDLAGEYVRALKAANPKLAEADLAYSQAASLPEFFDAGRSLLTGGTTEAATANSAPALAEMLARPNGTVQQAIAARAGATNAARETAYKGPDQAIALAKNVDTNRFTQGKIGELYGSDQAREIQRIANALRTFRATKNDILSGSKTADKLAEVVDTGNTAVRVGSGGVTARIMEQVDNLVNRLAGPNESVRNVIGRITLNPDASENQRILALAAELLKNRAAGSPYRAGAVEAISGNFGRE